MNQILDVINNCRTRSEKYLIDNQAAYIPTVNCDQIQYLCYNYFVDGRLIRYIPQGPKCCFKLKYINFKTRGKRHSSYMSGIHSLNELVSNNVIYPFMLFINGKFIPWDLITITLGHENYYLMVDSTNTVFANDCINLEYAQIINLPEGCIYEKDYSIEDDDNSIMFSFNDEGKHDMNSSKYVIRYIRPYGSSIIFTTWTTRESINAFPVLFDVTDIKLTDKNIILFKDGILSVNPICRIKKAHDSNHVDEVAGHVSPCLEFVENETDLPEIPNINLIGAFLTIDGGKNDDAYKYDICTFINPNYTESIDHISKVKSDALHKNIVAENSGETTPDYWGDLKTPFVLEMDRNASYEDNVANAISTIYSHDASIFNSVFGDNTNVIFHEKSYEWIMQNTTEEGVLIIPRRHSHMIDEYFLLFVNGELYKYRHAGKYIASNYYLPIQGINEGDTIELMRFQNINNTAMTITINKGDEFAYRDSDIINENMILFSTETDTNHFTFPANGLQHFPVSYTLEKTDTGSVKIILDNEFYYGKQLIVVSANRFQHFSYYTEADSEDSNSLSIDLGSKFMYCNDYSKYMVFYNGRKLNSDHFRLTLPVRPTTPFSEFKLYLTFPVKKGDNIDVVYAPAFMKDFVSNYDMEALPLKDSEKYINSDIIIDKSVLTYPLSSKLFMVWINGRKIPQSHITDIDSTRIRVNTDEKSIYNVCVTKYTPDIDALCNAFTSNTSLWDKITSNLTLDEITNMLGIDSTVISNSEKNIYSGAVSIKAIMYEIIREHYISNESINVSEGFIYDYQDVDQSVLSVDEDGNISIDADGNSIVNVLDSESTDNLDNVEYPWP